MALPDLIKECARQVRTAVYGNAVREWLARAIEASGEDSSQARSVAEIARENSIISQEQLDLIAQASSIDPAVEQMKVGTDGTVYNSADDRVRTENEKIFSQLSETQTFPVINGEVGVVNKNYPYGDVKRYGSSGKGVDSGSIDDNPFWQNAINSAFNLKINVTISPGAYVIKNTLYLPAIITFVTSGNKISQRGRTDGTVVYTYALEVFKHKTSLIKGKLIMDGIFMYNRGSSYAALFSGMELQDSKIRNNDFHNYGYVLLSAFNATSVFEYNNIQLVNYAFMSEEAVPESGISSRAPFGCTDAYIRNNYINGNPQMNAVAFNKVAIATSYISYNYIDFFKYAFDLGMYMASSSFEGNTIDYCYRGFVGRVQSGNIVNNKFFHIKKEYASMFPNATEEMKQNTWIGICCDGTSQLDNDYGFNRITIANNIVNLVETFIFVRGFNKFNVNVIGNSYGDKNTKRIDYLVGFSAHIEADQTNIFIDDLMYKEYTTLPDPSLTNTLITTFNKQVIFYKNKPLTNVNGKWIDAMGSIVTQ